MSEESDKVHFGDTELGQGLGFGIAALCLCLGIGGCNYLFDKGAAERTKPLTTEESVVE